MAKAIDQMSDPEIQQLLGRRLRALRKAQGLSVPEVSAKTGLSPDTIYRAERGDGPTTATLIRLLRAYGRLSAIAEFIPEPELSPMALLAKRRRRA